MIFKIYTWVQAEIIRATWSCGCWVLGDPFLYNDLTYSLSDPLANSPFMGFQGYSTTVRTAMSPKLRLREMYCLARISEPGWGGELGCVPTLSHCNIQDLSSIYHGGRIVRNETDRERKKNSLIVKHFKDYVQPLNFDSAFFPLQNTVKECLPNHIFSVLNKLLWHKVCGEGRRGENGALEASSNLHSNLHCSYTGELTFKPKSPRLVEACWW